jgi:hypothetical protein
MGKTRIFASLILTTLLTAAGLDAAAAGVTAEFSADTTQSSAQGGRVDGRVYVGRLGMRREHMREGQQVVEIVNNDHGKTWILFPADKTYIERPAPRQQPADATATEDSINPCAKAPQGVTCTRLGTQTVSGRQAEHWEIVVTHQGQTMRSEQWIDVERRIPLRQTFPGGSMELRLLGEEPVAGRNAEKWESVRTAQGQSYRSVQWYDPKLNTTLREEMPGKLSRELHNVVEGPQPASLFELPAGYRPRPSPPQGGHDGRQGYPAGGGYGQ